MLLQGYFTLSLMYMQSCMAVSVVVFKLLQVKVLNPSGLTLQILQALKSKVFKYAK